MKKNTKDVSKKSKTAEKSPKEKMNTSDKNSDIKKYSNKPGYKTYVIMTLIFVIIMMIIQLIEEIYISNHTSNDNSSSSKRYSRPVELHKPVIYLYPEQETQVKVKLDFDGELIADYPDYDYNIKGWDVVATPDSTIVDKKDNKQYNYLFWEGEIKGKVDWNMDKGFVVRGSDIKSFLQEKLSEIGLTPKEYNDFIVYWYPKIKDNQYNLISFAGKQYTDIAKLSTEPKYDSLLRVFMLIKPINKPIKIEPQTFKKFERNGFTVVEWGGTIIN